MDPVLHHYDDSSFSEKVRLALGLKNLAWYSVQIPAYGPKPDYTPLTAGYRRTPALQLGADVYCDTRLICAELERRWPTPSLHPGTPRAWARAQTEILSAWAEHQLFRPLALYVTGLHAARLPAAFHLDRAALHGKSPPSLAQVEAAARHQPAQFEPQLDWLEGLLGTGQDFVLGAAPGLVDFALYQGPWFLERIGGASAALDARPRLRAWMARVAAVGHGRPRPLSAAEALALAAAAHPAPLPSPGDYVGAEGYALGDEVEVCPLDQRAPARGTLAWLDAERIVLSVESSALGTLAVHFPRLGYRLSRAR